MSFLSVSLGAFGAHILKNKLSDYYLEIFNTGVQYQFFHSLAILLVSTLIANETFNKSLLNYSCYSFLMGMLLFSGSLYLMSFTGIKWLGAITPIGGLAFLTGWLFVTFASVTK